MAGFSGTFGILNSSILHITKPPFFLQVFFASFLWFAFFAARVRKWRGCKNDEEIYLQVETLRICHLIIDTLSCSPLHPQKEPALNTLKRRPEYMAESPKSCYRTSTATSLEVFQVDKPFSD